ncbi:MAG: hypothetical protein H8E01_00145 [Chloroflexi bacterium]|nr:hypothetical protein [Chloroflexota bacterium]
MSAKRFLALLNLLLVMTLLLSLGGQPITAQRSRLLDTEKSGQQVSLSGWFTTIWGDPKPGPGGKPIEIYMLTDDTGQSTQLLLNEELARSLGGILSLNRKRVIVEGKWVRPTVLETQSVQLDVKPNAPPARSALQSVSGPQPWISILCKFADVADEPKPLSYFEGMYSSTYPGLDHYWREVSYDIANVEGSDAVGWYTLPQPRSYYVYDRDGDGYEDLHHYRAANDCTAVADAAVYFPDYVGINLMFNDDLDGYAWGGGQYMALDGVIRVWRMTWEPPWGYEDITVMAHEMGHGFGLPHSSGAYGWTYDNQWDVMSDTWTNCALSLHPVYGCLGQHTISYHKDILGWIPAGQKYMATASSPVTLEQLALPQTANYKMVQIPIDGSANHFYTVEVRRKVGYDVKLPGQAVIIHEVDTSRIRPAYVVDVDDNGDTGDSGARWTVGETFSDVANSISVSVDSATATGFVVTITIGNAPTPTGTATRTPTATATWTPTSVATNTATATATPTNTSTPTSTSTPCVLTGDLDGDNDVDVEDVMLVANSWRCQVGDDCYDDRYDLDDDGDIDIVDIMMVVVHWGETC